MMPEPLSTKLIALASLHEPHRFQELLENHVYPFLDRLPPKHQSSLRAILTNASDKYEGAGLIGYEVRSKSIEKGLKDLVKHVKSDWKNGYEEQGEMMGEIVGEMAEWIPILWKVGVEMGVEHALVHKSLKFCKSSYDKLGNTNSRTEFSDMDQPEIRIEDNGGKVVYMVRYGSTEHAIIWVWRELLLSSIVSSGEGGLAKALVADIEKLDLAKAMVERLPGNDEESLAPDVSEPPKYGSEEYEKRDWELEERRDLLLNAHWTPEIRAAVPKLKALLVSSQVAEFKRNPTAAVYYTIVGATPELSRHLLASARVHFFDSKDPNISLHPAFGIFKAAGADQDLLRLLDSATARNGVTGSHKREAISYLMSRPGDVRTKARVHLESGLEDAQKAVISAMEHAFPTLPSAWRYLKKQVDGGILSKADKTSTPEPSRGFYNKIHNGVHPRPVDAARGPVLKAFCDKAGWTAADRCSSEDDDSDYHMYDDEDEEMYDDWRYQSRDEQEDITVDVISTLQQWVQVLDKWPIAKEQGAIKKKMRALHKNGQAFFDVDGVADALARRCDWGSDPCRQKLGRAIRQLYYSFAEDGLEKERVKQDLPKHLSFYVV